MKNLSQNKSRLATLSAREERLIEANKRHSYVSMILTSSGLAENPKSERYLKCLLAIHKEKVGLWIFNRENNEIYRANLNNAKSAVSKLLQSDLRLLTEPIL